MADLETLNRLETKAELAVTDTGEITGIAWPFSGPDAVGDTIEPGAFIIPPSLPICLEHDRSKAIGVWDTITETAKGLEVKGRLFVEGISGAKSAHRYLKNGVIKGLSISFNNALYRRMPNGGRHFVEVPLDEISICKNPKHPEARISAVKSNPVNEEIFMENEELAQKADTKTPANDAAQIDAKALNAVLSRLDKLEAKANRPGAPAIATRDEGAEAKKAFIEYLRTGDRDQKALTTASDTANHVLAPEQIESEFIRNLVEFSPVRQIADVRLTSAAKIILPHRTSVTNAVWVGETTTRTGSEPGFDQAEIDVKEIATFVDLSLQLAEDSANVLSEVNLALAEDFGQKESAAFVNGATGLEPSGFMANADIATTSNGHAANINPDALIALMYALPATYRSAGTWVMNGSTLAAVRTLKDGHGNYLWQPSYQAGQPETILGRPVIEAVDMPDIAEDAQPIIFGDFRRGYRIYDRLSLSILADPYSVRVNGLIRYHARRRVGADVIRPTAFRKLVMTV
ncbi:phage major capsid protein [Paracoccus sp. J56]|uniref:phage major capsid protein n=1 Tax=Paracoccus sp. J56 TaxID=935850 RepID=UPI000A0E1DA8|nr:phage major capsid protein [Paracoccus sp. J56]SMG45167.1 phage prohead protease, HK97 family/phage major capsid protein, HK97 family,TIGR01554 [Paracoccus sp. J56]